MIGRSPRADAGEHTEHDGERDHDQSGDEREHERVGDLPGDLVPDRTRAPFGESGCGVPEVTGDEAAEPVEVALSGRAVEAHLRAELGELLRRRGPAEDGAGSVARQHLGAEEDEHGYGEQRRETCEDTHDDEAQQGVNARPPGASGGRACARHVAQVSQTSL